MKNVLVLAIMLTSSAAFGTPGDAYCQGLAKDSNIQILVGRDQFGEPPVFMELRKNEKLVARFDSKEVREGSVIAYDNGKNTRLMNTYFHALNENGVIFMRFPEAGDDRQPNAYVTIDIPAAGLAGAEVEMTCEF